MKKLNGKSNALVFAERWGKTMKKKFKKIICLLTILTLFLQSSEYFFAEVNQSNEIEEMSYSEKIQRVQNLGISLEDATEMPEWIMDELIISNLEIDSYSYTSTIMDENSNNNQRDTTIDQDVLLVYNFISKNEDDSNSSKDVFDIQVYANWGGTPVCYFTDIIATSWSSDCSLESEWCGIRHELSGNDYTDCPLTKSDVNAGVAHEVDIKLGKNNYIAQKITIWRAKQSSPYNLGITSSYAHKTISLLGSIDVDFSSGGSPEFSAPFGVTYSVAHPAYNSLLVE